MSMCSPSSLSTLASGGGCHEVFEHLECGPVVGHVEHQLDLLLLPLELVHRAVVPVSWRLSKILNSLIQAWSSTVTPSGQEKSVTVSFCHSNQPFLLWGWSPWTSGKCCWKQAVTPNRITVADLACSHVIFFIAHSWPSPNILVSYEISRPLIESYSQGGIDDLIIVFTPLKLKLWVEGH